MQLNSSINNISPSMSNSPSKKLLQNFQTPTSKPQIDLNSAFRSHSTLDNNNKVGSSRQLNASGMMTINNASIHERRPTQIAIGAIKANHMTPRQVIQEARKDLLMNSLTNNGGANTPVNRSGHGIGGGHGSIISNTVAKNRQQPMTYNLSLEQTVNHLSGFNDTPFEYINGYKPRKQERDLINPKANKLAKGKRLTFVASISKLTEKHPGIGKYKAEEFIAKENWQSKNNTQKFSYEKRNSHIDKIFGNKDRKERNSPAAAYYQTEKALNCDKTKVHGGEDLGAERNNYFDDKIEKASALPAPWKYKPHNVTTFKPKVNGEAARDTIGLKIAVKGPKRFDQSLDKTDEPGPTNYKSIEAHNFSNQYRGKVKMPLAKRISFFDAQAQKSISPGPARHATSINKLNALSTSPSRKRL